MITLRTSTLALSGLALAVGMSVSGANASDRAVIQEQGLIQETRATWAPGFTADEGRYMRLVTAPMHSGMTTRLLLTESSIWNRGLSHAGDGRYVGETVVRLPTAAANVAHFEGRPSPGALSDGENTWVHFD